MADHTSTERSFNVSDLVPADKLVEYEFGYTYVEIDEHNHRVTTTFDDGKTVDAIPQYEDEHLVRAHSLGYHGSNPVWEMTKDHDLFHTIVAEAQGLKYSAALRPVATGEPAEKEAAHREECLVLLLQRFSNLGREGFLALRKISD